MPADNDQSGDLGPYHDGERAVQRLYGKEDMAAKMGQRMIRDHMPDEHRAFFAQLPFVVVGGRTDAGDLYATLMAKDGMPFMSSPDATSLRIAATLPAADPLAGSLVDGADIGLLGIEPHSRRRNRMNGTVRQPPAMDEGFYVDVVQSFGNCPQYIQARTFTALTPSGSPAEDSDHLTDAMQAIIAASDTVFIATAHGSAAADRRTGVDVSHRGGKPGFVRTVGDRQLSWPDFRGNYMFSTIGNIQCDPRAALVFTDFGTGDMLWISGKATVRFEGTDIDAFDGAERMFDFQLTHARLARGCFPLRSQDVGYARQLEKTGHW